MIEKMNELQHESKKRTESFLWKFYERICYNPHHTGFVFCCDE